MGRGNSISLCQLLNPEALGWLSLRLIANGLGMEEEDPGEDEEGQSQDALQGDRSQGVEAWSLSDQELSSLCGLELF